MIVTCLLAVALTVSSPKAEISSATVSGVVEAVVPAENGYCTLSIEANAGAQLPVLARDKQCSAVVGSRVFIRAAIEAAYFRVAGRVSPRFWLRAVTIEVLPL